MNRKLAIASDHAGYKLKEIIKERFVDIEWVDLGTDSADSVDYPDFGHAMAKAINNGDVERGVLVCGSGIGISIAANRHKGIRAANCLTTEMASLSRQHNNANVLALGERLVEEAVAFDILQTFLDTDFEGGRHQGRTEKLDLEG